MSFENHRKCNAQSKRSQKPCRNIAVTGSEKCRIHGGLSLTGTAHPAFRSGRYSKFAPRDILNKMEQAANSISLFDLSDEIQLLDARSAELLESLENADKASKNDIWAEITTIIEKRRRLVSSEINNKRITLFYVPLGEVAVMINVILATVRAEVGETLAGRHLLLKINQRAREYLGEIPAHVD